MDINDFIPKKQESVPIIQKDADATKYDAIAAKLCEKRKLLEEKLNDSSLEQNGKEELAIDLMQLKESMNAFGVTEVDYLAYLAYKESEGGVQLELF